MRYKTLRLNINLGLFHLGEAIAVCGPYRYETGISFFGHCSQLKATSWYKGGGPC